MYHFSYDRLTLRSRWKSITKLNYPRTQSTKITALRCEKEVDGGPIYLKYPLDLSGTAEQIFYRADGIIELMILDIINHDLKPEEQFGEPTYFRRRKPEESNLLNASSINAIFDMIRMLDAEGYPKAFLDMDQFRIEFFEAKFEENLIQAKVNIKQK